VAGGFGAGNGLGQGVGVNVAHVNQLNVIRMAFDGTKVVVGNAAAPNQGEADFAVGDGGVVMHGENITSGKR
jgi:hypothetical protein